MRNSVETRSHSVKSIFKNEKEKKEPLKNFYKARERQEKEKEREKERERKRERKREREREREKEREIEGRKKKWNENGSR